MAFCSQAKRPAESAVKKVALATFLTSWAASGPLRYHMQKMCFPMVVTWGRDQIQLLVAVAGLK